MPSDDLTDEQHRLRAAVLALTDTHVVLCRFDSYAVIRRLLDVCNRRQVQVLISDAVPAGHLLIVSQQAIAQMAEQVTIPTRGTP